MSGPGKGINMLVVVAILAMLGLLVLGISLMGYMDDNNKNAGTEKQTVKTISAVKPKSAEVVFAEGIAALRQDAIASGISEATVDLAFEGVEPDPSVIENLENQPEHVRAVWDYIDRAASQARIAEGLSKLETLSGVLSDIEKKYGVDRNVVVAIWGLESAYGTSMGSKNVIRSLATLAFLGGRRAAFGKSQLLAALRILDSGDIDGGNFTGSWAGAMGHTQFIPTTYLAHGQDFDGDGKRNIWSSVPDALASTANYLKVSGWRFDEVWGAEAVLPDGFDFGLTGYGEKRLVREWVAIGVKPVAGGEFAKEDSDASVILPAGARGPAFIVTDNFRAILKYNNATAYALGIAHLSDRLRGRGAIQARWPMDEVPLAFREREELQKLLDDAGFSSGGVDGIIGSKTRQAVRAFQRSRKIPEDGYPSSKLLEILRKFAKG